MREIKFRAWDKSTERMLDIETWHIADEYVDLIEPGKSIADINAERFWRKQSEIILMQYTGLKDKNGVEIYEGDVLFHPLQGRRKVFYPYSKTVASYGLRNIDNGFGSTLQDSHAVWEVIGNIYEQPELQANDEIIKGPEGINEVTDDEQ